MKAFRFRLETVAGIRALEELVAAERFMAAQRAQRQAEESVHRAERALTTLEAPRSSASMADHLWVGDQAERMAEAVRVCRQAVTEARSVCMQARESWDVAARRSGVLERLAEQELARWRSETLRQEAAELDDLSLARHRLVGVGR